MFPGGEGGGGVKEETSDVNWVKLLHMQTDKPEVAILHAGCYDSNPCNESDKQTYEKMTK